MVVSRQSGTRQNTPTSHRVGRPSQRQQLRHRSILQKAGKNATQSQGHEDGGWVTYQKNNLPSSYCSRPQLHPGAEAHASTPLHSRQLSLAAVSCQGSVPGAEPKEQEDCGCGWAGGGVVANRRRSRPAVRSCPVPWVERLSC